MKIPKLCIQKKYTTGDINIFKMITVETEISLKHKSFELKIC